MAQYLKPDSELGYIDDVTQIEYSKINNLRHVVLGCMLGDFNEVGEYVVEPEIVDELIQMEKYLVQTYDNIELCKSALKLDKQISFMVTFEGNRATLALVEKLNYEANFVLNSGTYSNINEYILDTVETSGEVNRNTIYDRWNIKVNQGAVTDIFNCDDSVLEKYFGITNRFKYLLEANKILLQKEEELEEIESAYSNEMLAIIARYPALHKAVFDTIRSGLSEKKDAISVKKPFFAKTFNELLENAIEKNLTVLNEEEQQDFIVEKRNIVNNLNVKRSDALDVHHVETEAVSNETSPKIIRFKTDDATQSRPLDEVAQDFVSEHKKVVARVSGVGVDVAAEGQYETDLFKRTILAVGSKKGNIINYSISTSSNDGLTEREKLVTTLVGAGIGAMVGGTAGAVVGAVAGAVVADVADKTLAANEAVKSAVTKKGTSEARSSSTKKPTKKPTVTKPAKKPTKKPTATKPKKSEDDSTSVKTEPKPVPRIHSSSPEGTSTETKSTTDLLKRAITTDPTATDRKRKRTREVSVFREGVGVDPSMRRKGGVYPDLSGGGVSEDSSLIDLS